MTKAKPRKPINLIQPPGARIEPLRAAFQKLTPVNPVIADVTIRRAAHLLAFNLAADSENPPTYFFAGSEKRYQDELTAIVHEAYLMSERLRSLSLPVANGLLREGLNLEALASALADIRRISESVDVSWVEPAPAKGAPKATRTTFVAIQIRNWFQQITGRRATVPVNPATHQPYGEFLELTEKVFDLIGYEHAASRAKAVILPP